MHLNSNQGNVAAKTPVEIAASLFGERVYEEVQSSSTGTGTAYSCTPLGRRTLPVLVMLLLMEAPRTIWANTTISTMARTAVAGEYIPLEGLRQSQTTGDDPLKPTHAYMAPSRFLNWLGVLYVPHTPFLNE